MKARPQTRSATTYRSTEAAGQTLLGEASELATTAPATVTAPRTAQCHGLIAMDS